LLIVLYQAIPVLFPGKTLLDFLQILITPLLVIVVGFFISRTLGTIEHERKTSQEILVVIENAIAEFQKNPDKKNPVLRREWYSPTNR
jgi:hypothetical protein